MNHEHMNICCQRRPGVVCPKRCVTLMYGEDKDDHSPVRVTCECPTIEQEDRHNRESAIVVPAVLGLCIAAVIGLAFL